MRDCRAAAAGGPPGVLPEVRAPGGQRGRPSQAQVRAHAAADHGRGETGQVCVIFLIFTIPLYKNISLKDCPGLVIFFWPHFLTGVH